LSLDGGRQLSATQPISSVGGPLTRRSRRSPSQPSVIAVVISVLQARGAMALGLGNRHQHVNPIL
jgi:hypothetical protein